MPETIARPVASEDLYEVSIVPFAIDVSLDLISNL
jgi:hypothetical protein